MREDERGTVRRTRLSGAPGPTSIDPVYVPAGRGDDVWAHFRSGAVVHASRDRTRHYPALEGLAPATYPYYVKLDDRLPTVNHVLDAGTGSGEGLRHLERQYRRATGIDKDPRALAFARQIARESRLVQADLESFTCRIEPAQLAYLVDTLGHLLHPQRALRSLAERLASPKSLVVAEPRATADQCLVPPARRAFSERSLHSLLVRGGFLVEKWLHVEGPFLEVYATAHRDPASVSLSDAETHFARGAHASALELADRSCKTTLPDLRLEALLAKARILIELEHRDEATALLVEARELDPADGRPLAALARLAYLAGNESHALSLAKEAVQVDLLELSSVCALGALSKDLEPRATLDAWLVAHALAPDHVGVALEVCEAALATDDCALAVTVLERLRRYHGSRNEASHSIAMAWMLAQSGRTLQARLEARLAETLNPGSQELADLREFLAQLASS